MPLRTLSIDEAVHVQSECLDYIQVLVRNFPLTHELIPSRYQDFASGSSRSCDCDAARHHHDVLKSKGVGMTMQSISGSMSVLDIVQDDDGEYLDGSEEHIDLFMRILESLRIDLIHLLG